MLKIFNGLSVNKYSFNLLTCQGISAELKETSEREQFHKCGITKQKYNIKIYLSFRTP